jgi:sugar lactone lactonase YvrE
MTIVDFNDLPSGRILADNLIFPECPRFHDGHIYIVDGPAVRRFDLAGNVGVAAQFPTMMLLGLQIEPDGTIYTGAAFDRTVHRAKDGKTDVVADLSAVVETPNNELVVLPGGEMLVGNMGFFILKGEAPVPSGLYRVAKDGSIARTGPDIVFPNGMVLLEGGRKLLVAGGLGAQVWTLDLAEDGKVIGSNVLDLTAPDHTPHADGIAQAADGSLWYGDMHYGEAVQCNADGSQRIVIKGAMNHVTAVWLFEAEGQEWLAMTGLMAQAIPQSPEDFTARLAIAPVSQILEAAGYS